MKLHTLLKATTTATDQGKFSAVISAVSVDREGDRVDPDGMVRALKRWASVGKDVPLVWNHSDKAEMVVGGIYPDSAKAVDGEVHVDGWVDLEAKVGAEVWRLVKSGVLGFSFGYLIPDGGASPNQFGGKDINELDVFEATATPTPMNNDTRVTGWKGLKQLAGVTRDQLGALGKERFGGDKTYVYVDDFDPDAGYAVFAVYTETDTSTFLKVGYGAGEDGSLTLAQDATEVTRATTYRPKSADALRRQADDVALRVAAREDDPQGPSAAERELESVEAAMKALADAIKDQNERARIVAALDPASAIKGYLESVVTALDESEKAEKTVERPDSGDRAVDPLRKKAEEVALQVAVGDTDLSHVKAPAPAPKPEPALSLAELKRQTREATLSVLTGGIPS